VVTNLPDLPPAPTALATPADTTGEFEALATEHAQAYRLPVGALVHPETVALPDPHAETQTPDRSALARADRKFRFGFAGFFASVVGFIPATTPDSGGVMAAAGVSALAVSGAWLIFAGRSREDALREINNACQKPVLAVPADVAAAYRAYQSAPAALRKAHAAEAVTGAVEDQSAYMDTLLVEAARLHAMDASATPEGLAVRDTMVRLAAQAQALATLAERNRALINAATLTTPMLLVQQPTSETFHAAAAIMDEETALVRGVLNAPDHP
jgi:hypothetical protein